MKRATTIVAGGAGFIGSHLVEALLSDGRTVVVVDDLSSGSAGRVPPAASLEPVDIVDAPALERVVEAARPRSIYHLAAQSSVTRWVADPRRGCAVNVVETLKSARGGKTPQRSVGRGLPVLGRPTRDYVHVADGARALIAAEGTSGVFNISTGVETDVATIFSILENVAGTSLEPVLAPLRKGSRAELHGRKPCPPGARLGGRSSAQHGTAAKLRSIGRRFRASRIVTEGRLPQKVRRS